MAIELIGNSPSIKNINELIRVVADTALSVSPQYQLYGPLL
jgi:hypothetical protein